MSATELIDWVLPVLSGIPDGTWFGCEITASSRGCLTARMRGGGAKLSHLAMCFTVPRSTARVVRRILPSKPPLAIIMLNDHAAQVMSLLDGMAVWLSHFEADDPQPGPIIDMVRALGGVREQLPVAVVR